MVTSQFMCRLNRCTVPMLSDFPPVEPFRPRSGVSSSALLRVAFLLLMVAGARERRSCCRILGGLRRPVVMSIGAGCRFSRQRNREDACQRADRQALGLKLQSSFGCWQRKSQDSSGNVAGTPSRCGFAMRLVCGETVFSGYGAWKNGD